MEIARRKPSQLQFNPVKPPGRCLRELSRHLADHFLEAFSADCLILLARHSR